MRLWEYEIPLEIDDTNGRLKTEFKIRLPKDMRILNFKTRNNKPDQPYIWCLIDTYKEIELYDYHFKLLVNYHNSISDRDLDMEPLSYHGMVQLSGGHTILHLFLMSIKYEKENPI